MSLTVALLALQLAAAPARVAPAPRQAPLPPLSADEQSYLPARAAAAALFGQGAGPADQEERALRDLAARLRAIVGPVRLPGLVDRGRTAYQGFSGLGSSEKADGLFFLWREARVFVTTRGLWQRAVAAARPGPGATVDEALAFATVSLDTAYGAYAEVPVRHGPSTRTARATVGIFAQAIGAWPPRDLLVSVERGERVYLIASELDPALAQVPACEARWNEGRQQEQDFAAYRRCVGAALPSTADFAAVVRQAQALVDALEAEPR
jgi:hypothetical protein